MTTSKTKAVEAVPIPPTIEVRRQLAEASTAATMLQALLRLAVLRDREQERLARLHQQLQAG